MMIKNILILISLITVSIMNTGCNGAEANSFSQGLNQFNRSLNKFNQEQTNRTNSMPQYRYNSQTGQLNRY